MDTIGSLHLRDLIESSNGTTRIEKIYNTSKRFIDYWNQINDHLLVDKNHPHYNFIIYEVYHDGNACCGRLLNWNANKNSKDPTVWMNVVGDNLIEMHFLIRAAEYILDKERL